jgi:Conserved hypothetical protein 95.
MNEETRKFIIQNQKADIRNLALKKAPANVDLTYALQQIEAKQLLSKKVPSWCENENLIFPAHLSIEQCSSEQTARYKAEIVSGSSLVDLTGGLGIDCFFLSKQFQSTSYVEQQETLCQLAKNNFKALQTDIKIFNEDSEDYLNHCQPIDCIFIDPARRDQYGHKTISISDCTPNVIKMQEMLLSKAKQVLIKLSPMLDISLALSELNHVKIVHIVAVNNDCKELLFLLERNYNGNIRYCCANLHSRQSRQNFTMEEEKEAQVTFVDKIEKYLYEPNAAIMKGGFFKSIAQKNGLKKLHPNTHLYTSDKLESEFPGRIFEVKEWGHYNKKAKQSTLYGIDRASVNARNFPLSVAELRKTLKLADDDKTFVFATTIKGDERIIIRAEKAIIQ